MKTKCSKTAISSWMVHCLPCKPIIKASIHRVRRCHSTFSTAACLNALHVYKQKPMFSSAQLLLHVDLWLEVPGWPRQPITKMHTYLFSGLNLMLSLFFSTRDCLGEPHDPCSCENWKKWMEKISEIQPERCKDSVKTENLLYSSSWIKCYKLRMIMNISSAGNQKGMNAVNDYCLRLGIKIAPFWFSAKQHWIALMRLWLSTDMSSGQ